MLTKLHNILKVTVAPILFMVSSIHAHVDIPAERLDNILAAEKRMILSHMSKSM